MSHLIPTPQTDKNGVTSIRHKKPSSVTGKRTQPAIPAVSPPVTPSVAKFSDEYLLSFLPAADREQEKDELAKSLKALRHISSETPQSFAAMEELLGKGTETAHDLLRGKLRGYIERLSYLPERYSSKSTYSALQPTQLRQLWNCGNVMEEAGVTDDTALPGRFGNVISKELKMYTPKLDHNLADDNFWRGVAAFTVTDFVCIPDPSWDKAEQKKFTKEFERNSKKFIEYAGKQKDIAEVIRVALDRKTMVVSDLKAIIAQGRVSPSLAEGAL